MRPLFPLTLFVFACSSLGAAGPITPQASREAQASSSSAPAASVSEDPVLARAQVLLEAARRARAKKDLDTARADSAAAIDELLAVGLGADNAARTNLLFVLGTFARDAGDLRAAEQAGRRVLEICTRTLPDDHPALQNARQGLATTFFSRGDLENARLLYEKVLEVRTRTLPDDHHDLQNARQGLAVALRELGDLAGSRTLEEKVLEVRLRTLPDDHPDIQAARTNLAITIKALGDLPGALSLFQKVLEVRSQTLPDDHPLLQGARLNLAGTIEDLGDLAGARSLYEKVLEIRSQTLPDDHPDVQAARQGVANTMYSIGDLEAARPLYEKVLEIRSKTLPDDHPDVQAARVNLALTIMGLGELQRARALFENALEVYSRTLSDDHPYLQKARQGLAATISLLGDRQGARSLEEKVLQFFSHTLPDDHPDLQSARGNLAVTLADLGDFAEARALQEKVLEVWSNTLPDDHPHVQASRQNLASTLADLGDLVGSRALYERVLEISSRTLPEHHPALLTARQGYAVTLHALGDIEGARALEERVLKDCSESLPNDHPYLQAARGNLAVTIAELVGATHATGGEGKTRAAREESKEWCEELLLAQCRAQANAAREALLESSWREAQARCETLAQGLDLSLSFAAGYGVFDPTPELDRASFELSEQTRGAAVGSAALMRRAAGAPRYQELRERLRSRSEELARIAQQGTKSEEFRSALARREATQRELVALALDLSGGSVTGLEFDLAGLASRLSAGDAVVGFRRYMRSSLESASPGDDPSISAPVSKSVASLCALVLRPGSGVAGAGRDGDDAGRSGEAAGILDRVELGPLEPIESAVETWRESLGVSEGSRGVGVSAEALSGGEEYRSGHNLRRLLFDPLLPALQGADRLFLALDDVLHLVPLDALPAVDGASAGVKDALLGERWRIETRVTLAELLAPSPPIRTEGALVVVGGVDYALEDRPEFAALPAAAQADASSERARSEENAGILRGGPWSGGFADLPGTGKEAEAITRVFEERHGEAAAVIRLEGGGATRQRLLELAPRARFLHVATHGWFASESIRSWKDLEPLDEHTGLGLRLSGEDQVRGMSPMLLCGLALAGANLPEDALRRVPGLVTAEELSTLDLTGCELAVLSACDTNVGERRAGQGVASLQMALQMAGARTVITSLWKVPDEATRELMTDFYRRIWVERKPKYQALWEAKMQLRAAEDEAGYAKYSTRDWAAWVLTGESD